MEDSLVFKAFGDALFVVMAAECPDFDYVSAWNLKLGQSKIKGAQKQVLKKLLSVAFLHMVAA